MTTLSPLAQRIYDVLAKNATTTTYMAAWHISGALGEEIGLCGVPGPGVEAMRELKAAVLVEEVPDLGCRYQLTARAWQQLLAAERERATKAERERDEARRDLETVHHDHQAVVAQLTKAEQERAALLHKAEQYDDVVAAVQDRDRCREAISKTLAAWRDGAPNAQMNELMRELAQLTKEANNADPS